jgi:hypothetical protein
LVVSSRPESSAKKHYQLAAIAMVGAALLAVGIVALALLVRGQRDAAVARANEPPMRVRAEAPSELQTPLAASRGTKSASSTARSAPVAPPASAPSVASPTTPVPATATGAVTAQPTVHPLPVAPSRAEPIARKARTDRKRSAEPPAPALPEALTRAQVIVAMRKVTPAVHACFPSKQGKAKVTFAVVGKTGRVVDARVTGKTGKVGSCIARSVRRARFPKFAKPRLEISYPFAF